jgi:hypothetical protein
MGNSTSNNKNHTETINWKSSNTDTISGVATNKELSYDIQSLVSNLRINQHESELSEDVLQNVLNKYLKQNDNQLAEQKSYFNGTEGLSDSPFITSDIYNHLQKKAFADNNINQAGGAKKKSSSKKKKQMKDLLDDDSSTSMTSSTEDLSSTDDLSDSEEKKKKRKNKKHNKRTLKGRVQTETDNLSYLSSSAHTGGEFTETNKSVSNENPHTNQDSIHTSDINMVSEY